MLFILILSSKNRGSQDKRSAGFFPALDITSQLVSSSKGGAHLLYPHFFLDFIPFPEHLQDILFASKHGSSPT
jgi:hypothetical protein